ncbi:MAG: NACHT domain-containing NTPase [Oculatellaceae cyanobacterium Prado106]|jgi:predicted NACHT family NTPase|nr:NACHT domain-containing NTPase [Oculatellaceae cyanobacterium Prado106]
MVKRSLRASAQGIEQAKSAFAYQGWTQENLAGEVGLKTRQSIWRFFTGQPIDRNIFVEICLTLDLDWRNIATDPPPEYPESLTEFTPESTQRVSSHALDLDSWVKQVRSQRQAKVQDQCGQMHLLDVNRPVNIDSLYIEINVLEQILSQQWLHLPDISRLTPEAFEQIEQQECSGHQMEAIAAVERHSKLRILGSLGSGKTTLLQYLATLCNQGDFAADRVPVFIFLRDFVEECCDEPNLLQYIETEFLLSGISDSSGIETLLQEGRMLLLLDGIDEVRDQFRKQVAQEIRRFSEKYPQNQFIVTGRTAAKTIELRRFTDVEIAPFSVDQIEAFAQQWFTTVPHTSHPNAAKQATQFIQALKQPENYPFLKLAETPLFCHLLCSFFQGQGQFSTRRSQFYKQCLDLLLYRWDEARGIERNPIHADISRSQKLKLMGKIALSTFERGESFFEQQAVERQIGDYLLTLLQSPLEPETLQVESEQILRSMELQHGFLRERSRGIFSFTYPILQEYFAAREFAAREFASRHERQAADDKLDGLFNQMMDLRWQEVFLITASLLRNADPLVLWMKKYMETMIAQNPALQAVMGAISAAIPPAERPLRAIAKRQSLKQNRRNLTLEQQTVLKQYSDAQQLLVRCLRNSCALTDATRQEIEAFLGTVTQHST